MNLAQLERQLEPLLPCPFCGSNSIALIDRKYDQMGGPAAPKAVRFLLFCGNCRALGPERNSHTEAASAWNARAGEFVKLTITEESVYGVRPGTCTGRSPSVFHLCGQFFDNAWLCTRRNGHDGLHEAHGFEGRPIHTQGDLE